MYIFNMLTVIPKLPDAIKGIKEISDNIWWCWNTDALKLFKHIDEELWNNIGKNPIKFLKLVSQERLEKVSKDEIFLKEYNKVYSDFKSYMASTNTYYDKKYGKEYRNEDTKKGGIAYFSAEYGLDETIPLYSGGLGILSGDHLKSASDLGLPFVGIGLMYKEGYFEQKIEAKGNQVTLFYKTDLEDIPIHKVINEKGLPLNFTIKIEGNEVLLNVWQINIGRVKLYLLDADIEENMTKYRELSYKLYGGGREMRVMQEMILGMGGVKLLEILGYKPSVYHMNEGHSAFLIIELIEKIMKEKQVSFNVAKEIVKTMTAFTTHTPVPAGNDVFESELVERMFNGRWENLGLTKEEFLKLGRIENDEHGHTFNMGVFALKMAGKRNGVSKLHGSVSRELFSEVWPNISSDESPITHVTNGVHTTTWLAPIMKKLYNKYLIPFWQDRIEEDSVWQKIYEIPNDELWKTHIECKRKLIKEMDNNLRKRMTENGATYEEIREVVGKVSEKDLIIGFARRFATYKRATIIFNDLERLTQLLNDEKRPVKLIFAGKAHPADIMGQELIKRIDEISKMPQFKGKIILLENYNMGLSRLLVSGVDVWMNNPRRPYEASGTSGQKAAINGAVNFSVLDGWWDEGYDGKNGFVIGTRMQNTEDHEQDRIDSNSIYDVLEKEIVPMYFENENNGRWMQIMKNSIASNAGKYSTSRMVIDYTNEIYIPLKEKNQNHFQNIEQVLTYIKWKKMIYEEFPNIKMYQDAINQNTKVDAGEEIEVGVRIQVGRLTKEDISVEAYVGKVDEKGKVRLVQTIPMEFVEKMDDGTFKYKTKIAIKSGGEFAYTYRIIPRHHMLLDKADMNIVKWYTKED